MVVERHAAPGTNPQTSAFLRTRDPATGAETRRYLDGHQVTVGRDFVSRSGPHQFTVLTRHDGLREVSLPDRRLMFQERFGIGPGNQRLIMRSVHTAMIGGAVVTLGAPLVRSFAIVPYRGIVIHPYLPYVYEPVWYDPFLAPMPAPLIVGPDCAFCPPPVVAFADPVTSYSDASQLLGDMVLASAVQEEMARIAAAPPPAADPEIDALATEIASLQQEVAAAGVSNEQLRAQIGEPQLVTRARPALAVTTIAIPEEVRRQVQREVKQCVALHREDKPLSLADVIASAEAQKLAALPFESEGYVFQVAELIEAAGAESGETCTLTTGDLAAFADVPGETDSSAKMKVVTSKAGSCPVGSVVRVSFPDLQEMLNGFNQRLEDSMKKVHDQIAAPAAQPGGDAQGATPAVSPSTKEPLAAGPRPIKGTVAGVIDAATLVIGERQIKLQGVDPGPVETLSEFASWVHARSPVECQEQDRPGVYRCLAGNGVDIGEAAILNGLGRAGTEASALYRQREAEAKQEHRGLWKSP